MKTKIFKVAVASGIMMFGLISCSQPNEAKRDFAETGIKNSSVNIVSSRPQEIIIKADSLINFAAYSALVEMRYFQNEQTLKEMRNILKSEVNAVQLEYNLKLYNLNKRNLEIKASVNDKANHDSKTWDRFKTNTNESLDKLEKEIRELSKIEP